MTTPGDESPLSSAEMIRRARDGLMSAPPAATPAHAPTGQPAPVRTPASPKTLRRRTRITPPAPAPRAGQPNVRAVRVLVAIMIVIALIGVGVAILVASVATAP